jgi:enoyl-CoA hydratase/carnithine racemase
MAVLDVQSADGVCRIALDRPDKLNALSGEVLRELTETFTRLADDISTRVVVLSGNGRAFSAGVDLGSGFGGSQRAEPPTWSERRHSMGGWQRLLDLMESVPQVTVASVHGHCVGGAALLAVACDIRVVASDAQIRIPELAIGIPLTWAGIPRLVREIGLPMARDLVMTGRVMDGREAQICGFAQRAVPAGDLARATDQVVAELMQMPPGPLAMTRDMFAAISRDRTGPAGWADPDLLGWAFTEAEGRQAAADYVVRRLEQKQRD